MQIETTEEGFKIHQQNYINKLCTLDKKSIFDDFRSLSAKLAWVTNTRPDISFSIAKSSQITIEMYREDTQKHVNLLNRVVKYLRKTPEIFLR